jgi:hypothetical protein
LSPIYTTESPKLFLIGNFLNGGGYGADWTTAATFCTFSLRICKTDFEGFVNFDDGSAQYKFIPQNTSFDGDYGNATGPDGTYTGLLLQTGESNAGLPAPKSAGYYYFKADTAALTYSAVCTAWL